MKRILLGAVVWLFAASAAFAQCGTTTPAGTVCGNPTTSQGLTEPLTQPVLGKNGGSGGSITLKGSSTGSAVIGVKAAAGTTTFNLPVGNGALNNVLITDGAGNSSWTAAGGGTVSSVGLALPSSILTVSGSPVTSTGTLTGTLATQTANFVWAGPTTGAAATPTFRSLVGADLPNPSASTLGGIQSTVGTSHQWISTISTSGVPGLTQPAFSDISGSITPSQCPNPSASTIGCVESYVAVSHQWINAISTSGVPSSTQPNFTDLTGNATLAQLPSISNNSVLGNNSGGTAVPSSLSASNVLDMIGSVQGDVLYRNATGWVVLPPGTNGQVFSSGGAAANPSWTTVSGTGTVTSVATNNGLTGGTITSSGTIGLATITAGSVMANITSGSAVPIANTPSSILDLIGSSTGAILYRSSGSGWTALAAGTNGQVLTQGASTPSWSNAGTLTNVTIVGAGVIANSGTCTISTSGTCTLTATAATKSVQQTGTSATAVVTPSQQQSHASAAKAWVNFTASGTINDSYNVSGVTKNSTGNWTITYTTPFTDTTYASAISIQGLNAVIARVNTQTIFTANITTLGSTFAAIDPTIGMTFVAFGTQ